MRLAFDKWKEEVFKKKLFHDVFELGKQEKIAAFGVRPLSVNLSSQSMFAVSKKISDTPVPDKHNRPGKP